MAERRPPGFNVDLGFYDSDEVLSIPRKIRAAAIGVWTLCGAYSANKLSDGYVPAEALRDRGCTPAIKAALMATTPVPLWVSEGDVGAIRFTRWAKWQRTSAEVKAYREADAERKRKSREAKRSATTSNNSETSGRTSAGQSQPVRPESGTPKTETETETKRKEPPYPQTLEYSPTERLPARTNNGGLTSRQLAVQLNKTERSLDAYRIAQDFSNALPVPIESGVLIEFGQQIDKCLKDRIPPEAIAEGMHLWAASDSWSPTQIPRFVAKAAAKSAAKAPTSNGRGKPTESAFDYQASAERLIAALENP